MQFNCLLRAKREKQRNARKNAFLWLSPKSSIPKRRGGGVSGVRKICLSWLLFFGTIESIDLIPLTFNMLALTVFVIMCVLASATADCWAKTKDYAWVDTRGPGHVQMGYLSAVNEANFPDIAPSGQPTMTSSRCRDACEDLGPKLCAAAQFYLCPNENLSWCNLITPTEFDASKKSPVFIDSSEESGISAVSWKRVLCTGTKEANLRTSK